MVIRAKRLIKGSKIGIVAVSDSLSESKLEIVKRGIERIEKMGFSIKKGKTIRVYNMITAGSPEERAQDFMNLVTDKEVNAIFFAWGGENASQILPLIDFDIIKKNPKIIMGHSDPTVLLNAIHEKTGLITFYGHFAASFDPSWEWFSKYDEELFLKVLSNPESEFELEASSDRETFRSGSCKGKIVGGCTTDLVKLIGTPYLPDFNNKILILESYVITPQKLLAHLTHLKQAGIFEKISGLILGNFMVDESRFKISLKDLFISELSDYFFPILKTKDFGHNSHMAPIPIGGDVYFDADTKKIVIRNSSVS